MIGGWCRARSLHEMVRGLGENPVNVVKHADDDFAWMGEVYLHSKVIIKGQSPLDGQWCFLTKLITDLIDDVANNFVVNM